MSARQPSPDQEVSLQRELIAYLDDLLVLPAARQAPLPEKVPVPEIQAKAEPDIEIALPEAQTVRVSDPRIEPVMPATSSEGDKKGLVCALAMQTEFTCLLVCSEGIRYAIPMLQLGRICRVERAPVAVAGQPRWQWGLIPGSRIQKVVSLEYFLSGRLGVAPMTYYVSLADSEHVLVCQEIIGRVQLRSTDVRWRQSNAKTPLVVGIVRESLTPLLDFSAHRWQER